MHINAKIAALGGLMLAFTEVCIFLGSVIESNTLFLLAAAAFLVGIMIREAGLKAGGSFYLAGVLLGVMISPNKFYVISYAGMGLYIWLRECAWERLEKASIKANRMQKFWLMKLVAFNLIYLTGIVLEWGIFVSGEMSWQLVAGIIVTGQIGFLIYDMAYEYVQRQIWSKLRNRLL